MVQGTARGKLLLFGEHSAVYGYPALGIPLDLTCTIDFFPGPTTSVTYNNRDLTSDSLEGELFFSLLQRTNEFLMGFRMPSGAYHISSTVPESGGFGSSAALCGSLARVILSLAPVGDGWELANFLEGVFHGSPSGVDTGLSLSPGPAVFFDGPKSTTTLPSRRFLPDPRIPLVYGALHRAGSTKELVGEIRTRMQAGDVSTKGHLESLGTIAGKAINLYETGGPWSSWAEKDRCRFGDLANKAHNHLKSLDLSTPDLDRIMALSLASGFRGGKLSGAGGGGAFYLIPGDWSPGEGLKRVQQLEERLLSADIALALALQTLA